MSIERLPFERRPRNSIANNLDRINELVDWVNQDTHLCTSASGERVTVYDTSSLKGLEVNGRSVQNGTPTPDAPVPVQVVGGPLSLVIGDVSVTINLQGNTLASLPDGTHDELHVDSAGRVWVEKRTNAIVFDGSTDEIWSIQSNGNRAATASGYPLASDLWPAGNQSASTTANIYTSNFAASSPGRLASGTIGASINNASYDGFHPFLFGDGSGAMTIDAWTTYLSSKPVTVIYQLATPQTIDLGYIDPPAIPSGSVVTISASLTPEFMLEWWVDDGITALVDDLIAYVDYKTEG